MPNALCAGIKICVLLEAASRWLEVSMNCMNYPKVGLANKTGEGLILDADDVTGPTRQKPVRQRVPLGAPDSTKIYLRQCAGTWHNW
jgi:hypothetical protein